MTAPFDLNWDAIGAISEAISAVAVVISLIYLAVQIRTQTAEARLAATRDLANQYVDLLKLIAIDEKLPGVLLRSIEDYYSLGDEDRLRVSHIFHVTMRNCEQQYLHAISSNADRAFVDAVTRQISQILSFTGFQQWWSTSSDGFDEKFVKFLDSQIVVAKSKEHANSFKKPPAPGTAGGSNVKSDMESASAGVSERIP